MQCKHGFDSTLAVIISAGSNDLPQGCAVFHEASKKGLTADGAENADFNEPLANDPMDSWPHSSAKSAVFFLPLQSAKLLRICEISMRHEGPRF
jgi:hypothetical protein